MSSETNKATVRRMIEQVWNERRTDLIEEFFDEDVVNHFAGMPSMTGLESVKQNAAMTLSAFPDIKLTIEDEIAEGDKVALRWTSKATHQGEYYGIPATGKQFKQSGMTVYRLVNAKIAEEWYLADNLSVMQQWGIIPALGAA